MNKLIFFSHNQNKIKEVKKILKINKLKILTIKDFTIFWLVLRNIKKTDAIISKI